MSYKEWERNVAGGQWEPDTDLESIIEKEKRVREEKLKHRLVPPPKWKWRVKRDKNGRRDWELVEDGDLDEELIRFLGDAYESLGLGLDCYTFTRIYQD